MADGMVLIAPTDDTGRGLHGPPSPGRYTCTAAQLHVHGHDIWGGCGTLGVAVPYVDKAGETYAGKAACGKHWIQGDEQRHGPKNRS